MLKLFRKYTRQNVYLIHMKLDKLAAVLVFTTVFGLCPRRGNCCPHI